MFFVVESTLKKSESGRWQGEKAELSGSASVVFSIRRLVEFLNRSTLVFAFPSLCDELFDSSGTTQHVVIEASHFVWSPTKPFASEILCFVARHQPTKHRKHGKKFALLVNYLFFCRIVNISV